MTRQELSHLLGVPLEAPTSDLLKAQAARLAELREQLQQEDLAKPVKIMLGRELGELDLPATRELIAQLEQVSRAETLLTGIDDEMAKSGWTRGVVELLCRKLEPLVPAIPEENERLKFEKRLVEIAEKIRAVRPPPPPPPPSAPPLPTAPMEGSVPSLPPHDVSGRLQSYFAEIDKERAKKPPARGVVRLWLQKIAPLIEHLPDESARLDYEKRIVEIEYWLDGSRPPWQTPSSPPVKTEPKPAPPSDLPAKPAPGSLLQFLPKPSEGTLRHSGSPIHFVARPRFVLGRQRSKSDFVTWFLPQSPANQQKTDAVSRVNTTLFLKNHQVWVHDGEDTGDGKVKASVGTQIDGKAITTEPLALNFTKERRLRLGQSGYEVAAIQLPAEFPAGPRGVTGKASDDTASSEATVVLPKGPLGCLRFKGMSCPEVLVTAVWIFSEASLGTDAGCAVNLDGTGIPAVALRVFHAEGGFWLLVPAGSMGNVLLDGRPLAAGRVQPLQAAHQLVLGSLHFELKVSA